MIMVRMDQVSQLLSRLKSIEALLEDLERENIPDKMDALIDQASRGYLKLLEPKFGDLGHMSLAELLRSIGRELQLNYHAQFQCFISGEEYEVGPVHFLVTDKIVKRIAYSFACCGARIFEVHVSVRFLSYEIRVRISGGKNVAVTAIGELKDFISNLSRMSINCEVHCGQGRIQYVFNWPGDVRI